MLCTRCKKNKSIDLFNNENNNTLKKNCIDCREDAKKRQQLYRSKQKQIQQNKLEELGLIMNSGSNFTPPSLDLIKKPKSITLPVPSIDPLIDVTNVSNEQVNEQDVNIKKTKKQRITLSSVSNLQKIYSDILLDSICINCKLKDVEQGKAFFRKNKENKKPSEFEKFKTTYTEEQYLNYIKNDCVVKHIKSCLTLKKNIIKKKKNEDIQKIWMNSNLDNFLCSFCFKEPICHKTGLKKDNFNIYPPEGTYCPMILNYKKTLIEKLKNENINKNELIDEIHQFNYDKGLEYVQWVPPASKYTPHPRLNQTNVISRIEYEHNLNLERHFLFHAKGWYVICDECEKKFATRKPYSIEEHKENNKLIEEIKLLIN